MKLIPTQNRLKKVYFCLLTIILAFAFQVSCRITLVPTNPISGSRISQQFKEISKKVDKFYLTMLETTKDEGNEREYSKFIDDYINIEVDLNALLNKNRIRSLNAESTRNCEIALETWKKFKDKHKQDNTLSDIDIELNRNFLRDLFIVNRTGEEVKKNAN